MMIGSETKDEPICDDEVTLLGLPRIGLSTYGPLL